MQSFRVQRFKGSPHPGLVTRRFEWSYIKPFKSNAFDPKGLSDKPITTFLAGAPSLIDSLSQVEYDQYLVFQAVIGRGWNSTLSNWNMSSRLYLEPHP